MESLGGAPLPEHDRETTAAKLMEPDEAPKPAFRESNGL